MSILERRQTGRLRLHNLRQGILKGEYHCTVDLLLTGLELTVLQIKTKIVSCHKANSKPEVNGTVILPPLVFPASGRIFSCERHFYEQAVTDLDP